MTHLDFDRDGARHAPAILGPTSLDQLRILLPTHSHQASIRLHDVPGFSEALAPGAPIGALAAGVLGDAAKPVRAVLFDKTTSTDWALGWHQDRTIAVKARRDVPGFGPWSTKRGRPHVEPPIDILQRMITLRVHLDDTGPGNASLLVALGSHRAGRVPVAQVASIVHGHPIYACLAQAGDAWLYAIPILHASEAAAAPTRRRVLQIDYAAFTLPGGLEWLGI